TFSVLVFDINRLKNINDDYGHEAGDRIIAKAAEVIKSVFPMGTVYRIGGDEFVAILDVVLSGDCIGRFKAALASATADALPVELEISAGYAYYDSGYDVNYKSVFNRADSAMYEDKREFYRTHVDRRKRL
ncbi:MAG: GGDEF domain-containing protein, partial [Lachnospiraceae bacterium]|nr:GGDEF domain-containing protein [Lachnospiraceae bacterium]